MPAPAGIPCASGAAPRDPHDDGSVATQSRGGADGFTLIELLMSSLSSACSRRWGCRPCSGARVRANEASAIASLRAINDRAARLRVDLRRPALRRLAGGPRHPAAVPAARAFLSADLAADPAVKSGYHDAHAGQPGCSPRPSATARRWPTATRSSPTRGARFAGTRYFFSNGGSNIWQDAAPFPAIYVGASRTGHAHPVTRVI